MKGAGAQVIHLQPVRGWAALKLGELWRNRELLYFMTWRDIKVRYKQALLGVGWAVLQPLLVVLVFSAIFGGLARLPSDGRAYPLFSMAGLLPWQLFQSGVQRASLSLVGNANLLTKVYFPRLIIPLSAAASALLDFAIALAVLCLPGLWFGLELQAAQVWLPLFAALVLLNALAVGIWFAALNVRYRDVQHALPFLLQVWLFVSPVAYSADLIPAGEWRLLFALNPISGAILGFRWALLGGPLPALQIALGTAVMMLMLVSGLFYFKRVEQSFADII
jgi:lipopolysaccharide transport system permease protein